jgi:protease PrsW
MPAWRARAHHLTRSRVFLAKASAAILGVSALIAVLLDVSRSHDDDALTGEGASKKGSSFKGVMDQGVKRLQTASRPSPADLIAWIRVMATRRAEENPEDRSGFDPAGLRLGSLELHPLIARHTTSAAQSSAVAAYARLRFLGPGEARLSAFGELQQIASKPPVPAFVNEMLGDAFVQSGRNEEALQAYMNDIETLEAKHSRRLALHLAAMQRNADALAIACANSRVLAEADPGALWEAAKVTGDRRLLFRSLWKIEWSRWMHAGTVPLALFAGAIWYIILVHSGSREPMRWWRYLPPIFAGIASVWLLSWWQGTLNYASDPASAETPTHEILQWIMHVGLPEEGAKLCLFAFFLPVLLHHSSGVKAALTAGCVGLGFAMEENLDYFKNHGTQVAIVRLVMANFVHVSLTGILGWHLYELFRTRFHHATEFLTAFCLVVIAHAVYDFGTGDSASEWGMDIAGIIVLAACARFYLPLLHDTHGSHAAGHHISRTSVFILGTALLSGILMIVTVWDMRSLNGITVVLGQLIGVAIVGLIYVREWHELN